MATHRGPRLNQRVLTVFLLVGLPVLAIGVGLVLRAGQHRLSDSYAQHLEQVALQTTAGVDAYVYRRVLDVSLLARTPELRAAASAISARPFTSDEATRRAVDASAATRPPANAASAFLADVVAHDRIYRQLLLTDRYGRIVAVSGGPPLLFVGNEDWWKSAAEDGRSSRVSVTDVQWDPVNRAYISEMTAPVFSPGSDSFAGLLNVAVDSREMLALVGGLGLGQTGEVVLLRDNGSVVFSRNSSDPNAPYFARDRVRDLVASLRSPETVNGAHLRLTGDDGSARLVGLAASQLAKSYPNLPWIVAVSQTEDELLAPVRQIGWYLFALFALTALVVLAVALYFSMRLASSEDEVAPLHLVRHPHVAHVGDVDSDEDEKPPSATVA